MQPNAELRRRAVLQWVALSYANTNRNSNAEHTHAHRYTHPDTNADICDTHRLGFAYANGDARRQPQNIHEPNGADSKRPAYCRAFLKP